MPFGKPGGFAETPIWARCAEDPRHTGNVPNCVTWRAQAATKTVQLFPQVQGELLLQFWGRMSRCALSKADSCGRQCPTRRLMLAPPVMFRAATPPAARGKHQS